MSDPVRVVDGARRAIIWGVDAVAAGSVVGAIVKYFPEVAALFGIVWYGIQIRESRTWRELTRRVRIWAIRQRMRRKRRRCRRQSRPR